MTRLTATRVIAAGNELGEGVLWCSRKNRLYWTDLHAATLWCHDPVAGDTHTWAMPERLASFALCADPDWLLLGLASRLAFFHLPSGACHAITTVEPDLPTRLNDGACDREGRFVFGTLHEPPDGTRQQAIGGFYRLNADLSLERLALGDVAISNAIAFSPDGRTMYFCNTPTQRIQCCDYAPDGRVSNRRTFADLTGQSGFPDGACVDADGGLWVALWGMGCVQRFDADGHVDAVVETAASQPTRAAFGGAALDTLFVVSAREGLGTPAPQAGDVFACTLARHGLPETCFAGQLADVLTP